MHGQTKRFFRNPAGCFQHLSAGPAAQDRVRALSGTITLWLVAATLLLASVSSASGAGGQHCVACHAELTARIVKKRYIHNPFRQQQCMSCHGITDGASPLPATVKWLAKGQTPATTHWFRLNAADCGPLLFGEADHESREPQGFRLSVPAAGDMELLENDHTPPAISDVTVGDVTRALFTTATITWQTDEYTVGAVHFGIGDLDQSAEIGQQYTKAHQATLLALKPNSTYSFAIESDDLFGNRSRSATFQFSTASSLKSGNRTVTAGGAGQQGPLQLTPHFFRHDGAYLLKVTLSRPATLAVGTDPDPDAAARPSTVPADHPLLGSWIRASTESCAACHPPDEMSSHPVNVSPKPGMRLPADYQTLPNGRISCITCHEEHGSDNPYRLRRRTSRELCIGCHKDLS